jgi:hypothetical protein
MMGSEEVLQEGASRGICDIGENVSGGRIARLELGRLSEVVAVAKRGVIGMREGVRRDICAGIWSDHRCQPRGRSMCMIGDGDEPD